MLRGTSIWKQQRSMKKKSQNEIEIIRNVSNVFGRTTWDRMHCWNVNGSLKYFYCGEILRKKFYSSPKWNFRQCIKNRIYISQATYPIKGLHILIEALAILKRNGLEFEVCIAGADIFDSKFSYSLRDSNYARYIKRKVNKYGLNENIRLLGVLNEDEVIKNLLQSNLFVCSSGIENSPNSLGEAMMLGVPVITSYVGGIPSMISNEKCLFCANDSVMLAGKICELLIDTDLQNVVSREEIAIAEKRFDKGEIIKQLLQHYESIINGEKEDER